MTTDPPNSPSGAATVRVFPDSTQLSAAAAAAVVQMANAAVQQRGHFDLVLAGGNTPRQLYEDLASSFAQRMPWAAVRLFWGDERCVPADHPQSNYRMAMEALISRAPIAADQILRMPGEVEPPPAGARQYEKTLRRVFDAGQNPFPRFDLVLLGLGEDGHTASLFPGNPALRARRRWVVNVVAPSTYATLDRLTLTAPVIDHARAVFYLVAGANKQSAVQAALAARPLTTLPTSHIRRPAITWFLDAPAAALL